MNPLWYAKRLARMTPAEVAGRARDELVKRRWRRRQVRPGQPDPLPVPATVPPFAAGLPPASVEGVPGPAQARILEAADGLLAGSWPVFDRVWDSAEADWFADPRTGRRAPADAYCFDVDHRDEAAVGNVKYLWEPSRHQHVTLLAAAWLLSGDDRYAEAAARQLRSWWAANPFLSGVHWTSAIEVGVRLVSWTWTRRLLHGWGGAAGLFEGDPAFRAQLHHHQEYLAALPSRGSSANNHVLAEAAGQFAAACAFPWFPESAGWRAHAADTLRRELPRQTFPDGLNRELATGYHGFVLELGLAAALEGEAAGHPLGGEVWDALRRMVDALAAVLDVRLHPPRQGDDDEGQGLLLDPPGGGPGRWASLLATGAVLFGPLDWWPTVPRDDARTPLWTALAPTPQPGAGRRPETRPGAGRRPETRPGAGRRPETRPSLFPGAGMTLLRDGRVGADELWCRVDHGPHGYLGIAAHAHADALAVELRVGGVEVLADPGTYCYHGEPAWRAYFRSTAGHNTLEVGGVDQSVSGGPFLWARHARSELEHADGLDGGPVAEVRAAHHGYERLRPPAVHRRTVRLLRGERRLVIEDRLDTTGEHDCRLAFHLGPGVACTLRGTQAELTWPAGEGKEAGRATIALPEGLAWERVEGRTDPPAGWYSLAFDVRVPTVTLLGAGRSGHSRPIATVVQLDPAQPPEAPARPHEPSEVRRASFQQPGRP